MARRRPLVALALVLGLATTGCSSAGSTSALGSAPATTSALGSAPASQAPVVVGTATTPSAGTFLTAPNGMTLYVHAGDTATTSTCTGTCATSWPPLTVAAGALPAAGTGAAGTLGTLTRADGARQVTYNGQPLYLWQGDAKAGDATGDGVNGFALARATGAPAGAGAPARSSAPVTSEDPYSY